MNTIQIIGFIGMIGYFLYVGTKEVLPNDEIKALIYGAYIYLINPTRIGIIIVIFTSLVLVFSAYFQAKENHLKIDPQTTYIDSLIKENERLIGEIKNIMGAIEVSRGTIESYSHTIYLNNPFRFRLSDVQFQYEAPNMGALKTALSEYHEREHHKEAIKQQTNDLRKELNLIK